MATVVLVRHATTAVTGKRLGGWTPGVHLDDAGRVQAQRVAERLAPLEVAAVHASPLERTCETAAPIAALHGLEVRVRGDLGEVDYGTWTDRSLAQLRRRTLWPVIQRTPSRVQFPQGETIRGMQARAVDAVEAIAAQAGKRTVVVVSHADVIKAVVAHFVGMPLDAFQRLLVAPASLTTIVLHAGEPPLLLGFNEVPGQATAAAESPL